MGLQSQFLEKWNKALDSYGIENGDFRNLKEPEINEVEFNGKEYRFVMTNINEYWKLRGKISNKVNNEINIDNNGVDPQNCYLCRDINFANSENNGNVIEELENYLILPNKYPTAISNSLFVPKKHDDMINRVKKGEAPYNGKTRGNLLTVDFIKNLAFVADKYNLVCVRNHQLDCMSVPYHDHFHMFMQNLTRCSLLEEMLKKKVSSGFPNITYLENTPFENLNMERNDESFYKTCCDIVNNLEKENHTYTLLYYNGNLLISPRKNTTEKDIRIGAGIPMHYIIYKNKDEEIENIKRHVPLKGEFHWEKFLPTK